MDMQIDAPLVTWITHCLTGWSQYVRLRNPILDSGEQHRAPSEDSPVSFPVHILYVRLQTLLTFLPSTEFSDDSENLWPNCGPQILWLSAEGWWTALRSGADKMTNS